MIYDEFGDVINGKKTYEIIAAHINMYGPVLIAWSDEQATHFDILFTFGASMIGTNNYQGGIKGDYLFVSIMRIGAFGFELKNKKSVEYVAEKLTLGSRRSHTAKKLTELLNGIIEAYLLV